MTWAARQPDGHAGRVIVVDGSNVRGAVPDGWWRDRDGAMHRLALRLQCLARSTDEAVVLVLDTGQPDLPDGDNDGISVITASRSGRNAADGRILELLDEHAGTTIEVITSDRALADAAVARPAVRVTGAGAFLRRLNEAGC